MKKLYVNNKLVATGNYQIEEIEDEPKYSVRIEQDELVEYPFEYDDTFTLYSNHRYFSPDKHDMEELFNDEGNLPTLEQLNSSRSDYDHFRIWSYEHGMMTVSASPFSCPWDSGLLGIVSVRKDAVNDTKEAFESYVKTLDQVLQGDVYTFILEDELGETVDACGGFYGHDETTLEEMLCYIPNEYGIGLEDLKKAMDKCY